jgi:hypothetical protein
MRFEVAREVGFEFFDQRAGVVGWVRGAFDGDGHDTRVTKRTAAINGGGA